MEKYIDDDDDETVDGSCCWIKTQSSLHYL